MAKIYDSSIILALSSNLNPGGPRETYAQALQWPHREAVQTSRELNLFPSIYSAPKARTYHTNHTGTNGIVFSKPRDITEEAGLTLAELATACEVRNGTATATVSRRATTPLGLLGVRDPPPAPVRIIYLSIACLPLLGSTFFPGVV
jgi:hypothetical protein